MYFTREQVEQIRREIKTEADAAEYKYILAEMQSVWECEEQDAAEREAEIAEREAERREWYNDCYA